MKNNIIKTDTIWYKIKNIFRNLFFNKKKDEFEVKKEKTNTQNDFKERIKTFDEEKERLIQLQEKLRNNEIEEKELSKEDINNLSILYDAQIYKLTQEINDNKAILEKLKKELSDDENED